MKKPTNWDIYLERRMRDPGMRELIDKELASHRRATQAATKHQKKHQGQVQRAARSRKRSSP